MITKRVISRGDDMGKGWSKGLTKETDNRVNNVSKGVKASVIRKMKVKANVQAWRERLKQKLVDYKGGKCERCGYNKCLSALHFHHTDPNIKDFGIGMIRANPKSWDSIIAEVDKCIMVCANCHAEIHDGILRDTGHGETGQTVNLD